MPIPEEAAALLRGARVMAHLATCDGGDPHVAPVWYRYEDGVVELTTEGRKLANLRANARVALSVQKDVEGETRWTVTALGTAEVVEDEAAFERASRRINRKYGADADAYAENTLVRVALGSATARRYD